MFRLAGQRPCASPFSTPPAVRRPPTCRDDFEIGIICTTPCAYDAVSLLAENFWDDDSEIFGKAAGDANSYATCRIGYHDVVMVLLPQRDRDSAAASAAMFRASYTSLRLVILVGACQGLPTLEDGVEVRLGDVLVCASGIQQDLSSLDARDIERLYDGVAEMPLAGEEIRSLLETLRTKRCSQLLKRRAAAFLEELQSGATEEDIWETFEQPEADANEHSTSQPSRYPSVDPLRISREADAVQMVGQLKLTPTHPAFAQLQTIVQSRNPEPSRTQQPPSFHLGRIASGIHTIQSASERDFLAQTHNVIGFDTEAAGVWDSLPCILVNGVYGYADGRDAHAWTGHACATAATYARALLERVSVTDRMEESSDGSSSVGAGDFYQPSLGADSEGLGESTCFVRRDSLSSS